MSTNNTENKSTNVINLFELKKQEDQETKDKQKDLEKDFSFEELMKANEEKRRKLEKQRFNDNNQVKKSYKLKPKK